MSGSGGEGEIVQRLAELEDAMASLGRQLEELATRVQEHAESLELVSDVARHTPLRELLEAGRYQEADQETALVHP